MTKTIYWATYNQDQSLDLDLTPKRLVQHIAKSQSKHIGINHVACPAIRNKHRNTFYTTFPYDLEVIFQDNKLITNRPNEIFERVGLYEGSYAFDWGINRIFFSETPQILQTSPAFLQQTSYGHYGHLPSGAFDISKWFRPSVPAFQLWSGVKEFRAFKDEPQMYFDFPNEDAVELLEFKMTETLYNISNATVQHKFDTPKEKLVEVYKRFTQSGLNKKVLNEIKANLA
jgi:hypothetical protein